MSNLNKLIEKLCPNGVEYKKLEDLLDYEQPTRYIVKSTKYNYSFNIPVLTAGQSFILGYTDENENTYKATKEEPVIIFDDFTTGFHWVDFEFKVKSSAIKILSTKNSNVNLKYIYYVMKTIFFVPENHSRHWISVYSQFSVPIPPLEIQEEIVHILDNFTELSEELSIKLSAELKARQRQYEYYRDSLLEFSGNISKVKFGEIAIIQRGASPRPISNFITDREDGVYWIKIGDVEPSAKYITHCKEKITIEGSKKSRFVKKGDFILSNSMSFGRPYILKIDGCIHDGWLSISNFQDYYISDFLYHLLNSNKIQNEFKKKASFGGAVQNLNADIVRGVELPLPSLEEQKRIVNILDKFESLYNDISEGLLAEIEARQKQYEYYRDKLLTFKELNVEN